MPDRLLAWVVASSALIAGASLNASEPDLVVLPESVTLSGPEAFHRLLVMDRRGGELAGEAEGVTFSIGDEAVATVEKGVVRPVGDGTTTVTATTADGRSASASVTVEKSAEPFAWSFRNHVQSVLTKAGCNSGACHGAAAGQNGFKLSLRGYDP
ncbi:MAG TPA: S-layer protein, partial [Planctomycetaceae bacterium]